MSDVYDSGDILGKTLYAAKRIPYYRDANDTAQPVGYIESGQPVGVVYSYLDIDPSVPRSRLWWMFWPEDDNMYFVPQVGGFFDVEKLRAQGVLTDREKAALAAQKEQDENETWLEKLLKAGSSATGSLVDKLIPAGVVIVLGYFVIKEISANRKGK